MPETSAAEYYNNGGVGAGGAQKGQVSLARKNLTNVYGKVRNKYNE
jgi:hypothetical protein